MGGSDGFKDGLSRAIADYVTRSLTGCNNTPTPYPAQPNMMMGPQQQQMSQPSNRGSMSLQNLLGGNTGPMENCGGMNMNNCGGMPNNMMFQPGQNCMPGMNMPPMNQNCMPQMGMPRMNNNCQPGMNMPSMGMPGMNQNCLPSMGMPRMNQNCLPGMGMPGMNQNCLPTMNQNCRPQMNMPRMNQNCMPGMTMPPMNQNCQPGATTLPMFSRPQAPFNPCASMGLPGFTSPPSMGGFPGQNNGCISQPPLGCYNSSPQNNGCYKNKRKHKHRKHHSKS